MSLVINLHKFERGRKSSSTRNCKPHVSVITQLYRLLWIKNSKKYPKTIIINSVQIILIYIRDFKTCLILLFFTDISKVYNYLLFYPSKISFYLTQINKCRYIINSEYNRRLLTNYTSSTVESFTDIIQVANTLKKIKL